MKETAAVTHGYAILRLCYPHTETSQEARTRFQDQLACCTPKTYASRTTSCAATTHHLAARALRQPRRAPRLLISGRTRSTSTSPCAATTHHLAARALRQPCRAPRVLVSRPQRLYIDYAVRRHDVVFWAYDYFDYYLD
jgi:hypothetical protein